jgi:hypothetical protein
MLDRTRRRPVVNFDQGLRQAAESTADQA